MIDDPDLHDSASGGRWLAHLLLVIAMTALVGAALSIIVLAPRYLQPYMDLAVTLPAASRMALRLHQGFAGGVGWGASIAVAGVLAWLWWASRSRSWPLLLLSGAVLALLLVDVFMAYALTAPKRNVEDIQDAADQRP